VGRIAVASAGLVVAVAAAAGIHAALGAPGTETAAATVTAAASGDGGVSPLTAAVAAGTHWRLTTPHGAVHVWIPAGYHRDGAATVLYVHGYYTDVDGAWRDYQLPEQFALSGINAMFIACEAPAHNRDGVSWTSASELMRTVRAGIGRPLPSGPVIAIGHSGAFRTLLPWLDEPKIDWMVMVDAAYGDNDKFVAWVKASPQHHLYFVGDDTIQWTEEMLHELPATVVVDWFPPEGLPADARAARIVYVRSQFEHMPLVTAGVALPALLRAMPAEILPGSPWAQPLGVLPTMDAGPPDGGSPDAGVAGATQSR